jgi:hypothetical protein
MAYQSHEAHTTGWMIPLIRYVQSHEAQTTGRMIPFIRYAQNHEADYWANDTLIRSVVSISITGSIPLLVDY